MSRKDRRKEEVRRNQRIAELFNELEHRVECSLEGRGFDSGEYWRGRLLEPIRKLRDMANRKEL